VTRDDLGIFAQLRNEFATELENITTGVNNLESRVAFLEDKPAMQTLCIYNIER
jgi:hypothetical protein